MDVSSSIYRTYKLMWNDTLVPNEMEGVAIRHGGKQQALPPRGDIQYEPSVEQSASVYLAIGGPFSTPCDFVGVLVRSKVNAMKRRAGVELKERVTATVESITVEVPQKTLL